MFECSFPRSGQTRLTESTLPKIGTPSQSPKPGGSHDIVSRRAGVIHVTTLDCESLALSHNAKLYCCSIYIKHPLLLLECKSEMLSLTLWPLMVMKLSTTHSYHTFRSSV